MNVKKILENGLAINENTPKTQIYGIILLCLKNVLKYLSYSKS